MVDDPFRGAFHSMFRWGMVLEGNDDQFISEVLGGVIREFTLPLLRGAGNHITEIIETITNHLDDGGHGPIRWFEY